MNNTIANSPRSPRTPRHIAKTLLEFFSTVKFTEDACPDAVTRKHWEQLKAIGFDLLGQGTFSVAIVHDDYPDLVFKVSLRDGDAAQAYILKCREWHATPKQRYLPYVYFTLKAGHFWCCAMPKYTPNKAEVYMSYIFDPKNIGSVLDVPKPATWSDHILADSFPKWEDVLLFAATATITAEAAEKYRLGKDIIGNHYPLNRITLLAQAYINTVSYMLSRTVRGSYSTYSKYLEAVSEVFELERSYNSCFDAAWDLYAGLRHTLEAMLADEVLYDTLTGIKTFFDGLACFDLHGDNWMLTRDDKGLVHIVITDPVSFTEKHNDANTANTKPLAARKSEQLVTCCGEMQRCLKHLKHTVQA